LRSEKVRLRREARRLTCGAIPGDDEEVFVAHLAALQGKLKVSQVRLVGKHTAQWSACGEAPVNLKRVGPKNLCDLTRRISARENQAAQMSNLKNGIRDRAKSLA
jgi:hypothetical protein